jgi:transcriptional regulator with XRE-family HTH domain
MSFLSAEFGKRLRAMRISKQLTQSQLAEIVGVETATISRWETGEFLPSDENADALLPALGATPADFFKPPKPKFKVPKDILEALSKCDKLELELVRRVLGIKRTK